MKQIFTLLALFVTVAGFSQKGTTVTGSIIDGSQKTVESATISLLKATDSAVVKYAVASREGNFKFEDVAAGSYRVSVSAVGHEKGFTHAFKVTGTQPVQLPTLTLIPTSKAMVGVVVTARKPLIEQKIDRTVVNVDAAVTNAGTSALEVLEKAPGVSVDKDGNINLKGKDGVMVMVDGRPTQLSAGDLANYLKNMNSSQLDQIEIMTNPPARFDAAGNAGVINIKTKKNKAAGYNGSVTLGYTQGIYPKTNEGIVFNYREGKVNLFTNLSHGYRENWNQLTIQRKLMNDNGDLINYFDQTAKMNSGGNNYSFKIGADYFANKKTTVGVVFNGMSNPSYFNNRNINYISNPSKELENETRALVANDVNWKNFGTNLNFRRLLDTTGKELTVDLDYVKYHTRSSMNMINSYWNGNGTSFKSSDTLLGSLPQLIDIYSGRVDYTHPLKNNARFEAGLKSSVVRTDNNATYDSIINGNMVRDIRRSNHFVYEENINAAYANLSSPLSKKLNAQLGLRLEHTNAKGNQKTTGETFDRNYVQLFPTAFLQYKLDDKNTFGVNYGRRIRRPNYQSLNPFIRFLDRYTYQQGNPDLKPQLSDNIELSHTFRNFLTTTINYSSTNDIIQTVLEQKGDEAYAKDANIASMKQYGLAVSANMPINSWWTNSIYVNVYNNQSSGLVNNEHVSVSATTLVLNGSQQFKLSKTLSVELSGWYRTAGFEGVLKASPMGMMNAGISKQVLENKGTVRLTVRDIFWTSGFSASAKYANVDASFQEIRDSRVVNIGFTYRFSKGKVANTQRKRASSAADEQSRVGGGNN